ncbi:hypothetical protein [Streptomyces sp. E5N91]|uniref:hypothetical protein n=1 Tax=Streptomyces sp. E5N91 TaxID=1851996 RepID=UPI001EE79179|nr:hypothetical protein [Streptomyces sp. E5N91]
MFEFYERSGHRDPAGAWRAFTGTWNWAAPLTAAVPRTGPGRTPAVRPVPGGFALSGQWCLSPEEATGNWVALPLADSRPGTARDAAGPGGPDLYVMAATRLAGLAAAPGDRGDRGTSSGRLFRLADVYVPAGFGTRTAAPPLRAREAPFLWTAVAALALGAARRMTDELPGGPTGDKGLREAGTSGAARAELAGMLHDERLSTAAALHGSAAARQGLPAPLEERLAARAGQVADVVHHVLAVAYQQVLAESGNADRHPLVRVIEASSPILQLARYATELLPPDDRTSRRKAEHGDDRRISG